MPSTSFAMQLTSSIVSTSIGVMPELAIPADAYPEPLNKPGGGKDNLCQFVTFCIPI